MNLVLNLYLSVGTAVFVFVGFRFLGNTWIRGAEINERSE